MLPNNSIGSTRRIQVNLKPWLLPGILILATLLRIYALERDSLWVDELDQVLFGKGSLVQTLGSMTPPIDYLVTNIVEHYVGQSEGILRLPTVLWGVLSVLVIYDLGRYLFDDQVAYLAAFLLAIMPIAIQYSREVRYYALPTLLILVSVYTCVRAANTNTRIAWLFYGAAIWLALFTHVYAVPVLCILGFWLIVFKRPSRGALLAFATTSGVGLLCFATWFMFVRNSYLYSRQIYNNPILSEVMTAPFFDVTLGGAVLDPNATVDMVRQKLFDYLGVIRWTVFIYWTPILCAIYLVFRRTAPRALLTYLTLLLLLFFGGIGSAFLIDYVTQYFFAARQFLFFTPMALLIISATYLHLARNLGARMAKGIPRRWITGGIAVFIALLSVWIMWEPLADLYKPSKQDWRGTARYLLRQVGPEDVLLSPYPQYITYYAPELLSQMPSAIPQSVQGLTALARVHEHLWIVLVHSSLYERPPTVLTWIQDKKLVPLMFGHDLEVYRYSRVEEF